MLLLVSGALAQPIMAQERADLLWNFANELYHEQDFYRALGEYQRFIFLFPSDCLLVLSTLPSNIPTLDSVAQLQS